jgi:hypothetical protein
VISWNKTGNAAHSFSFLTHCPFSIPSSVLQLNYISAAPFKVCPSVLFISTGWLNQLEQLLKGIAMMKELTLRTRDYLVSFGECMSPRIFAAYMNKLGKNARQVCEMFSLCFYTYLHFFLFDDV